ncbi:AAA family ATPase [Rathayibacter sp. AY2B3]|nr:AAA family ATPase [Rathayibacter sp. AY2B3]
MRGALSNPFQPGSDVVPAVWAGRVRQLSDWRDVLRPRLSSGLFERGRTILGEPGLGKSTLVRRIAADAAARGDLVTPQIRIALGTDVIKRLASECLTLADKAGISARAEKRIATLLARVQSIAVSGYSLALRESQEGQEPHTALSDLLVEIGRKAIEIDRVVLIHLDEIQNITDEKQLSQVLIALGDVITHEVEVEAPGGLLITRSLPIAVYLTRLPEFEDSTARKGATFIRRFETTVLAPIDDDDLRSALRPFITDGWEVTDEEGGFSRIRMASDAAETIIHLCQGEPFLFQLAGQRAWYAGTGELITRSEVLDGWTAAEQEATAHVERILDRLPQREREFLEAMAGLPVEERTLSTIANGAGFAKATDAGTTSQRLDRVRGIIRRGPRYRFRHRAVEAFLTTDWPAVGGS